MTKVDVISGFLGAGKTTLIKKLTEEKLGSEKLVIIENEFGEIGIDASLLKTTGIEIREINSGCICCTLAGDFEKAIEEILTTYGPDRIIIEPSGVGKLSDVIKSCNTNKLKDALKINMLITVVDVMKYRIYNSNFGEFFENQIKNAKTIILSRTQKVDEKLLESTFISIRKLNNKANIITTPWTKLKAEQIITLAQQDEYIMVENQISIPKVVLKNHHSSSCICGYHHDHHNKESRCRCGTKHDHLADEVFDVWGTETPKIFEEANLRLSLEKLENEKCFGSVLRGKGILQVSRDKWVQFDYVPGEIQIKSTDADYTGRICVIGSNLNKEELIKNFNIQTSP